MFQVQGSKIMLQINTLVTGTTWSEFVRISMARLTDHAKHINLQLWLCLQS